MTSLFVLSYAPAQVVSALEARSHWSLAPDNCFLIADPRLERVGVGGPELWRAVRWVPLRFRDRLPQRAFAWRRFAATISQVLSNVGPVDRLFLGHDGDPMRHIANASGAHDVVVLDTGLATAQDARDRVRERLGHLPGQERWRNLAKRAILGLRLEPMRRVTYFSALPLHVEPPDLLIQNRFEFLRQKSARLTTTNETWVLGQNFVKSGMLAAKTYHDALRTMQASSPPKHVYIVHPREEEPSISAVARLGFEVRRLGRPVELELALGSHVPRELWGISSTALLTCAHLLGDRLRVRSLAIPAERFALHRSNVESAYEVLKQPGSGVEIVEDCSVVGATPSTITTTTDARSHD